MDSTRKVASDDVTKDTATRDYFDQEVPRYGQNRFKFAVRFLNEHASPDATLIDVGCGAGKTLALLKQHTGIKNFIGLDVSSSSLEATARATGADTLHGSILQEAFVVANENRFDYAVLGAVLHHVIEKTEPNLTPRQNCASLIRCACLSPAATCSSWSRLLSRA